jgi:hypothetical protein
MHRDLCLSHAGDSPNIELRGCCRLRRWRAAGRGTKRHGAGRGACLGRGSAGRRRLLWLRDDEDKRPTFLVGHVEWHVVWNRSGILFRLLRFRFGGICRVLCLLLERLLCSYLFGLRLRDCCLRVGQRLCCGLLFLRRSIAVGRLFAVDGRADE